MKDFKQLPLVSIITPCFNSEKYVDRYLESVLKQTYKNIQQIIVNDGSIDNTEKIVLSYVDKFKKQGMQLTYLKKENGGIGSAINAGLKLVKGEYFCWCDSDNMYLPDYVIKNANFLTEHTDFSVVRCDGYYVEESNIDKYIGTMCSSEHDKTDTDMFLNCLKNENFHFGCAMIRTSDFIKANKGLDIYESRAGQNWQLLLPIFYKRKSGCVDEPLFIFVIRKNSVSNSYGEYKKIIERNEEFVRLISATLLRIGVDDYNSLINTVEHKYYLDNFWTALNKSDKKNTRIYFNKLKKLGVVNVSMETEYRNLIHPIRKRIARVFGR